ncbi:MAG: triose-phosphate isomerase [candidate division WOR-3 bacterium]|jgi:triosephosphate isomerase
MKIIAGNWKMNLTFDQANTLANSIKSSNKNEIILFPPSIYALKVKEIVKGKNIKVGVQNIFYEDFGAYTGEISAIMVKSMDLDYVLIGHSERRKYFFESDEIINKKLKKAIEYNLDVILCVGETLEERENNKAFEVVKNQVLRAIEGLNNLNNVKIAYEPVWAIGTGINATPEQANEMHQFIKEIINIPVLYGGSVNEKNAYELLSQEFIDGLLIGGASLKAEIFNKIIEIAELL